MRMDRQMLGESRRLFAIARTAATRLEKYNGLRAETLYHPPRLAARLKPGPHGDYVLSVGRLESIKRPDLAVQAMRFVDPPIRLLIVGDGTVRTHAERMAAEMGVADRVKFLGTVGDDRLIELYAGALAVVYAPYDEDYGYVTLEAFLARKPVITAEDSGGTLEFVEDSVNGLIGAADPEAIGTANQPTGRRPAPVPGRWVTPALNARARLRGTVSWRNWLACSASYSGLGSSKRTRPRSKI